MAIVLLGAGLEAGVLGNDGTGEYEVKAAFLYNFAKYVEWPQDMFASASDPIVICVLGRDPFGTSLDRVLAGKSINGHAFAIQRLGDGKAANAAAGCHVLFVRGPVAKGVQAVVGAASQQGHLTVGDEDGSTSDLTLIRFTKEDGKIRFEINTKLMETGRLRLSSKLLSLATIVRR
jgi:hypothetical protein